MQEKIKSYILVFLEFLLFYIIYISFTISPILVYHNSIRFSLNLLDFILFLCIN